jgi:hypothetical protein
MDKRVRLREELVATFPTVAAALKDERCEGVQKWVVSSIMNPYDPSFVAVPDPDAVGGEAVAELCKRFGIM